MKHWLSLLLLFLLTGAARAQTPGESSCIACHRDLGDGSVEALKNDVHGQRGLSCESCHGGDPQRGRDGDPAAAMDPARGYVGAPRPREVPAFCGRCHSDPAYMKGFNPARRVDQAAEYETSVHGQRLRQGDDRVATCVQCHGGHGIRSADDPRSPIYPKNVADTCARCHSDAQLMNVYKIPHDQKERYLKSVHAEALLKKEDLSAPTCNDCHGNHGAVPPGASSVAAVCRQCHSVQAEAFAGSPHREAFRTLQMPECITCHENHEVRRPTDEFVGTGKDSVCIQCHVEGDAGYQTAQQLKASLEELKAQIERSREILHRAEVSGMEVRKAQFGLTEAHGAVVQGRNEIHRASAGALKKVLEPGRTKALASYQAGEAALSELQFRRKGLAVSLVFILTAIGALVWKIRTLEKPEGP